MAAQFLKRYYLVPKYSPLFMFAHSHNIHCYFMTNTTIETLDDFQSLRRDWGGNSGIFYSPTSVYEYCQVREYYDKAQ